MTDTYGALTLPVPTPTEAQSLGDPALDAIGAYLQAVLIANLQTAWLATSPLGVGTLGPGGIPAVRVVQTLWKCSPEDGLFQKEDLPALFVWRGVSTIAQLTDDWQEKTTEVSILWVTRPADQPLRARRSPISNAVADVIARALNLGCDPAWIDPADTDPESVGRGSLLADRGRFLREAYLERVHPQSITIQIDESQARPYWAVSATMKIHELYEPTPQRSYFGAVTPPALLADVTDSTGRTLVEITRP